MAQELIIYTLWFVAVTLGAYGIISATSGNESRLKRRLRSVDAYTAEEDRHGENEASVSGVAALHARVNALFASAGKALNGIWPKQYRRDLSVLMVRSGRGTAADVDTLLAQKLVFGLLAGLVAYYLGQQLGWSAGFWVFMMGGSMFMGFFLPDSQLNAQAKNRRFRVVRELPDVIDMLTISVTAGMGFEQAIVKLVTTAKGEIATEFDRLIKEVNAGAERKLAMIAMAERVDVPELSTFITTVLQAESFGTPIAAVLKQQAGDLRMRRRESVEERAQKAPVKMTVPVMLLLLPASMLMLLGPAMMSLFSAFK